MIHFLFIIRLLVLKPTCLSFIIDHKYFALTCWLLVIEVMTGRCLRQSAVPWQPLSPGTGAHYAPESHSLRSIWNVWSLGGARMYGAREVPNWIYVVFDVVKTDKGETEELS